MYDNILQMYQQFCTSTAKYPAHTSSEQQAKVMYLALGLNGEAGEVAEKIKKWYRDDNFDLGLMEKELGDCLWYISQICTELGVPLERVVLKNRDKLQDRANRDMIQGNGDER